MRIATTFENGKIFQHFGKTPQFKFYDVEDGGVVSSQIVPTSGGGHGTIPGFLEDHGVDAIICGGLGGPMRAGLAAAGIELVAGISGDADAAVAAFLAGELEGGDAPSCGCH